MPMVWGYVSELQPPAGLLFIPLVTYEYGELWWDDIDRGETEQLVQKPVPVPLCSPQIPHGLWNMNVQYALQNSDTSWWQLTSKQSNLCLQ
jgi:hypothetical protein